MNRSSFCANCDAPDGFSQKKSERHSQQRGEMCNNTELFFERDKSTDRENSKDKNTEGIFKRSKSTEGHTFFFIVDTSTRNAEL